MPYNLLRLLNPSFPVAGFSLMKLNPRIKPSRVIPVLSRAFPHRLKYQCLSKKLGFPNLSSHHQLRLGIRRFSTRSSEVRASKSLIEDEAELSDWVSDLRSDSFKTRSYSEDDDNGGSGRGRGGSGRGRSDRGGRDSAVKRRRESDSDDYGGSNRGRGTRDSFDSSPWDARGKGRGGSEFKKKDEGFVSRRENGFQSGKRESGGSSRGRGNMASFDSFSRNSRVKDRFGEEVERKQEGFVSRRENGFQSGRRENGGSSRGKGNMGSFDSFSRNSGGKERFGSEERKREGFMSQRRGSDSNNYGISSRGTGRGRRNVGSIDSFSRNSRGKERFGGESEGEDDGFTSQRRENSFRGGGRGGGGLRGGGKSLVRGSLMMSDEEDVDGDDDEEGEEKLMDSFRELISDEDDDNNDDGDDIDDDGDDMSKKGNSSSALDIDDCPPTSPRSSPGGSDSYLSETRFDQCSVSPLSLKAIKDAGYEKMTIVQEATLPVILKGKDVLAKAKTGTGKTVAFLLPSIEVVAKSPPVGLDQKRPPILVLVICPTRELASQAAAEANTLVKYHPSIGVQVVIGGTRLALEQKRMQANPCQILVATPGRLKDHIENTAGFATRLMGVKVLVLDEADHLLDMGFRKDIERIIAAVPKQRQTLLFSATVPAEVRQICLIALKRDHEFINTVQEGSEETHAQVKQTHLVAPLDKQFSLLYALLKDHIADDVDYKVLVFCTTAMVTRLVADLLGELNLNVREIHSRKPQSYRTRVSDEFRKSKGLILVTSDVSARGVDYPDVTLVIQVGLPADKAQYIHRLGRTGRKGKEGQGILLLSPWEEFFLSTLKDLPISKAALPLVDPDTKKKVEKALSHVEMKNKEAAYQAWLGYYNSNKTVGKDKYRLVELANEFSRSMGLDNPPAIPKLVLGKMGLRNIPGLRSK